MIEAVDTRAKGLRRPRSESVDLTAFLGRLDWILLGAVAALVGYGLWAIGGITQHDIPGNSGYYVVRQGVYAAIGAVALVAVVFIDPEYYRRHKRVIYVGTLSVMLLVLMAGLLTSMSRSGLAGAAAGLVLFVWLARGRMAARWIGWMLVTVAAMVALAAVYAANVGALTTRLAGAVGEGFTGRAAIWRQTWPMVRDFWPVGSGVGTRLTPCSSLPARGTVPCWPGHRTGSP